MNTPVERLNAALEGRYRIERELGQGGMATVYLADDIKHERKVALKVLKPELAAVVGAERFLAEIKTTANLQHPHILPLFDSGEADKFLFYVMPYVEGETLGDRLDRDHQLPVDEAVQIATAVANALDYAHRHGVIHRDIKPANLLIHDGQPVISDFGIALAVGTAGQGRLTETGLSVGTPHYMSPEQATGDQTVGVATDIYALGAVLYEMLVGDPPYTGSTAQAILGKIIAGKRASATEHRASVPRNVDAAIRKSLEKLPADRFIGAQDFSKALGDPGFRHGEEIAAGMTAGRGPWKPLALGLGALAVVFGVGFGWSIFGPEAPERPRPVTRVSVAIPEAQFFHPTRGDFDLSDDGSLLVYRGVGDQGQPQLWARRWDALDATPIRDTDQALFPELSPDGLEVVIVTGTSVRVVPLQGGVSRTLVDVGVGRCCPTWSPDGAWIYYTDQLLGLRRVPAAGGEPETVVEVNTAAGDQFNLLADILPGGAGAVFASPRTGGGFRIQAVDLETGDVKDLTAGTHPRYSPTGHLLFIDGAATLLAAPFDVERLELTGAAVPVAEGLAVLSNGVGFFAVSETGRLVYRTGAQGGFLAPAWVDRDGTTRDIDTGWTILGNPTFSSLTLSPDGTRLSLSIMDPDTNAFDLWVKQLDQGPLSRVTFEGTINYRPTWSSDGRSLTYMSDQDQLATASDLFTKRADGGGTAELVLHRETTLAEGMYSPDGTWLVFRQGDTRVGEGDIYAMRPGTDSTVTSLVATDFLDYSMALSPNGRWMAYVSNATGRNEVYVSPFPDAGSGRQLVSPAGGVEPVWAHSGRELFYRNGANELVAVQVDADQTFAVGQQDVLFPLASYLPGGGHPQYDVSADDQRFVMLRINDAAEDTELILVENWAAEPR
jgi:Tol biopolymer transport system component